MATYREACWRSSRMPMLSATSFTRQGSTSCATSCSVPRAIHSSRCGASAPIVVESPWPVRTVVSPGRVSSLSRIDVDDRVERRERPPRRSRPALEQRVAAEHACRAPARTGSDEPGEWPGVCSTRSSTPPAVSTSPSASSRSGARFGCVISHSGGSAGLSRIGAAKRSASAGAGLTWSSCAWVQTTATTRRPPTAERDLLQRRARRRRRSPRSRRRRSRRCCRRPTCRRRARTCRT